MSQQGHREGASRVKRASREELRKIFQKYASVYQGGEPFMTNEDFVKKYLKIYTEPKSNTESVKLLAGIVDADKDGLISFHEFEAYEGVLCSSEALSKTAFQLFDTNGNGLVSYSEFAATVKKTDLYSKIAFDLNGSFIERYFGSGKQRLYTFVEFSQLIRDYPEEYAKQAFFSKNASGSGFISPADFKDVMVNVNDHLLTSDIRENLLDISQMGKISFSYFVAFTSLLTNIELIKRVYLVASKGSRRKKIMKDDLLRHAQVMSNITPLEIDILYQLMEFKHQKNYIDFNDLHEMTPKLIRTVDPESQSVWMQTLESLYRFGLGSIAGITGAAAVYPIDLVKTRMQNQRIDALVGKLAYKNSWDCFQKVIKHEGVLGLYRGLPPQVVGVAPEKAIKLTVNDFVRGKLTDINGNISKLSEIFAGGCSGASQVIFTNPLEIVKIRLQTAGEISTGAKVNAFSVIRQLGLFGLYKGSSACFLRDIPFTAIYFPVYAHLKSMMANKDGYNPPVTLLTAGTIAGVPAAGLVTPADVIKTRLQVVAREGQTKYKGIFDAAKKIMREEGPTAFWKGAGTRICRSSPQFGITLITYELLQRSLYVDFGGAPMAGSRPIDGPMYKANRDHIGGYKIIMPVLYSIETKYGLRLPRFE